MKYGEHLNLKKELIAVEVTLSLIPLKISLILNTSDPIILTTEAALEVLFRECHLLY